MEDDRTTPFEDPGLLTGYPLDQHDRDELDEALRRLESDVPASPNGSAPDRASRAAAPAPG